MAPVSPATGPPVTKLSTTVRQSQSPQSSYDTSRSSTSSSRPWSSTGRSTWTSRPVTFAPRATTIPERTITSSSTITSSLSTEPPKRSTTTSSTRRVTSTTSTNAPSTSTSTRQTPTTSTRRTPTTSGVTARSTSSASRSPTRPPFSSTFRSSSSITSRRTTLTSTTRSTTSPVTSRRTTPRVSTATYITGSSGHPIVVTNMTPFQQSGTVNDNGDGGSPNTAGIVVGILVPLILIGIIALSIYIWYRKKYPVRMGIGRNFSTFSNPAYNKRASTVTLVREDGNKIFEEMTRRSPEPIPEENEDNLDEPEGRVNEAYEGESPTYENLKPPDPDGLENGAKPPTDPDTAIDPGTAIATDTVQIEIEHLEEAPKSVERPRKKAVLISTDENLDSDFELVTEDDLGRRRESELSVGNDSVDTRTVSLSFSEIFDGRHERKKRSSSEIVDIYKTREAGDLYNVAIDTKPRSNSDSAGVLRFGSSARLRRASARVVASPLTIPEKTDDGEDEFVKLEEAVNKLETGEIDDIPKALLNEIVDAVSGEQNVSNERDEAKNNGSDEDIPGSATESSSDSESSSKDLSSDEDKASSDSSSSGKKRLSVQISKPNIVLDTDLNTPYVIVQDSIIFETETQHHVHLDSSHNVIRGRRAFTMNDILSNVTSHSITSSASQYNEERSKSSPDIFLDDSQDTERADRKLDIASEKYMSVSASDTDITKDNLLIQSPALVKPPHETSLEHLPMNCNELVETDESEKREHLLGTIDNPELSPKTENHENKAIDDHIETAIVTEHHNTEAVNELNTDTITETQHVSNNKESHGQNEPKIEDSNYMLEKLKLENSMNMSASFEPITESFESINSSETKSLNSDTQQNNEPVLDIQELTVQNQEPSNDTCNEAENGNAMLRASTPNIDAGKLTLYEEPITQNVDKSATEPSEKAKTKITTGTFKFNMNDDSESDTSSDDGRNAFKSSIDSAEYTHVQKNEASVISDSEAASSVNDDEENDGVAKQTLMGTNDMVTSLDSASTSLSWEILDKSTDDTGVGEAVSQIKADLSWDLADDNEEDC